MKVYLTIIVLFISHVNIIQAQAPVEFEKTIIQNQLFTQSFAIDHGDTSIDWEYYWAAMDSVNSTNNLESSWVVESNGQSYAMTSAEGGFGVDTPIYPTAEILVTAEVSGGCNNNNFYRAAASTYTGTLEASWIVHNNQNPGQPVLLRIDYVGNHNGDEYMSSITFTDSSFTFYPGDVEYIWVNDGASIPRKLDFTIVYGVFCNSGQTDNYTSIDDIGMYVTILSY